MPIRLKVFFCLVKVAFTCGDYFWKSGMHAFWKPSMHAFLNTEANYEENKSLLICLGFVVP